MDPIALIFKLVERFVPMGSNEYNRMYVDAQKWKDDLNVKKDNNSLSKWEEMYIRYTQPWGVRLLLAVLYIPLVKWIMDFMNPSQEEEEEAEND